MTTKAPLPVGTEGRAFEQKVLHRERNARTIEAIVRDSPLHQVAVAGAAVSDPESTQNHLGAPISWDV